MSASTDIALLRAVPTFEAFDTAALFRLADSAEARDLAAGEALFHAGEEADCGYVVVSGRIELVADHPHGGVKVLQAVGPGALIGETALLVPTSRPATALAAEPSRVLRLPREPFLRLLADVPQTAERLRRAFAKRLEQTMKALDKVRGELEKPRTVPRRR